MRVFLNVLWTGAGITVYRKIWAINTDKNLNKLFLDFRGNYNVYCAQKTFTPLFFSGGRIDHGHHAGQAVRAITDAVALAKAVSRAVEMVDKGDHAIYMLVLLL